MDVLEAIKTRSSVPKVTNELPVRSDLEELIECAIRAPNHHLTQPWRFVILSGSALEKLGEVMAKRVEEQHPDDPSLAERMGAEKGKAHRAPVILTLIYVKSAHPLAIEHEDRYAVGAALQNILLAAHGMGLAAYVRTGPAVQYPGVTQLLGLQEGEEIAGFVYLGIPTPEMKNKTLSRRDSAESKTSWMGWEESSETQE